MKKYFIIIAALLFSALIHGQTIEQSTGFKSTGMTTAQLNALPLSIKTGLTILDTDLGYVVTWDGSAFVAAGSSGSGDMLKSTYDGDNNGTVDDVDADAIGADNVIDNSLGRDDLATGSVTDDELADFLAVSPIDFNVTVNENPVTVGTVPVVASNSDFTWTDPSTFDDQTIEEVLIAGSVANGQDLTGLGYVSVEDVQVRALGEPHSLSFAHSSNESQIYNTYAVNTHGGLGRLRIRPTGEFNFEGRAEQSGLGGSTYFGLNSGQTDDLSNNNNTGFGADALRDVIGATLGNQNSAFGKSALLTATEGNSNNAFGYLALSSLTTGGNNSVYGVDAMRLLTTGSGNIAIGNSAGEYAADGTTANQTTINSIYLGYNVESSAANQDNEIAIGYNVEGNGSNTVTIGNPSITDNFFSGDIDITGQYLVNGTPIGSGGSGHTIQDEGVAETDQPNLNFVGPTVDVTNDAGNSATVVTITDASLSEADQTVVEDRNVITSGTGTRFGIGTSAFDHYFYFEQAANSLDHRISIGNLSQGMTFTVNEGFRLTSPMSMFSAGSAPTQHIGRFYYKTGANAGAYVSDGTTYTRLLEEGEGGSPPDITFNNKTADYTVVSTDFDSSTKTEIVFDSATEVTLTIDDVATAGETVSIVNHGVGEVIVQEGTGTINAEGNNSFKITQYAHVGLVRYASDYRPRGAWTEHSSLDDADNRASTFASWREEDLVAGTTTDWTDRINSYVAVANGGITASAATTGVQFSYDGVDDTHSVNGQSAAFNKDPDVDNFSIAMRFGDNVPSDVIRIIYYADGNGDADAQYAFRRQSSTGMRTYTKGLFDDFTVTDTDLTDDVFVITFDTVNVRVYQNGTLVATNAVEGIELATNAILSFASTNGGTAFETAMTLRDVVFYDEVLDQTAVTSVTTALQN